MAKMIDEYKAAFEEFEHGELSEHVDLVAQTLAAFEDVDASLHKHGLIMSVISMLADMLPIEHRSRFLTDLAAEAPDQPGRTLQ